MAAIKAYQAYLSLALFSVVLPALATSQDMLDTNKAIARRLFEEALSQSKWDVYLEIHATDFVAHSGTRTATLAEDLASAKEWRKAFPDATCSAEQLVAEGDSVTARWTCRGTNTGVGQGLPATGKAVVVHGITIFRVKEGKLAEEWGVIDTWGMLRQLGLVGSEYRY